jgi:hypothetical protein
MRSLVASAIGVLSLTAVSLAWVGKAAAGGLEYTGPGTQALGRGGAVAARADDPMVLTYNPAGLAELRGGQIMISGNVALMHACVDPIGYYGWGAYEGGAPSRFNDPHTGESLTLNLGSTNSGPEGAYYTGRLDTVCMKQGITPIPQLAFTARLSEDLGIGFGMMFPTVTSTGSWGGTNGVIHSAVDGSLRPSPVRYMMLQNGTIGMFPTVGLGYRLAKWLRLGATFEWGVIHVDNTNMAAVSAGTTPAADILARVQATDWFIPAFTTSLHIVPTDAIDIVAAFHYQADLDAPGTIKLTTGVFDPTKNVHTTTNTVVGVQQKMPWKLRGGFRYADRLAPRPNGDGSGEARGLHGERVHDPLEDERWDIELDAEYQMNARNQDQYIRYTPMQQVEFEALDGTISSARFPDVTRSYTRIPKRWKDQVSLRLGGTYNILPGLFGISAGVHYENRGVDPSYMQIDYWPVSNFGLHMGIVIRVARSIDFVASYAHIFQETLVIGAPPHDEGENISMAYAAAGNNEDAIKAIDKRTGVPPSRSEPAPVLEENPKPTNPTATARLTQNVTQSPAGEPPWVINSGTYRSGIDVFSAGMNMHF